MWKVKKTVEKNRITTLRLSASANQHSLLQTNMKSPWPWPLTPPPQSNHSILIANGKWLKCEEIPERQTWDIMWQRPITCFVSPSWPLSSDHQNRISSVLNVFTRFTFAKVNVVCEVTETLAIDLISQNLISSSLSPNKCFYHLKLQFPPFLKYRVHKNGKVKQPKNQET